VVLVIFLGCSVTSTLVEATMTPLKKKLKHKNIIEKNKNLLNIFFSQNNILLLPPLLLC
tara:strand:+ start:1570 stop:1746 length:177 start_codon:yes stop_codon:yes gene_type:complete